MFILVLTHPKSAQMRLYTFVFLSLYNVGKDCKYNQIVTDTFIYNRGDTF